MNKRRHFNSLVLLTGLFLLAQPSSAHPGGHGEEENYYPVWSLEPSLSSLDFASTKNAKVTEKHSFAKISGSLLSNNQFVLTIDLSSVNASIEIRNERINKHIFNTEKHKKAMVIGQFDLFDIPMKGQSIESILQANLYFQNLRLPISVNVTIENQGEQLVVSSNKAIILSAETLQITEGVDTLKGLANLKSISPEFPVSFKLVLKR